MLSVPFYLSFFPLMFHSIFMKLFDRFGKFILFVILSHPAKLLPNERATTLTRSAISNETQQIMPEKCPVK